MTTTDRSRVMRYADARLGIPDSTGANSVIVLQRGTLDVKFALPERPNRQTPHAQDELYAIIRGRGVLFHDGRRDSFEPGDLLFVAAGTEHHFEDFSEDLAVWRVFYGVHGGEIPA